MPSTVRTPGLPAAALALVLVFAGALPSHAVWVREGNGRNLSAPTGIYQDSGWQYQGNWGAFPGTPIASRYFITAAHFSGPEYSAGSPFVYNGQTYIAQQSFKDPNSDLLIWRVDRNFDTFAPLYTRQDELGKDMMVIGRGVMRGSELVVTDPNPTVQGWQWGGSDSQRSWGVSRVSDPPAHLGGPDPGFLAFPFRSSGADNAVLTLLDSGGGTFINDNGVWKLAGINYGVFSRFSRTGDVNDPQFVNAGVFDMRGLYLETNTPGTFFKVTGATEQPTFSYATRISTQMGWINSVIVPEPGASLLLGLGLPIVGWRFVGRSRSRPRAAV